MHANEISLVQAHKIRGADVYPAIKTGQRKLICKIGKFCKYPGSKSKAVDTVICESSIVAKDICKHSCTCTRLH